MIEATAIIQSATSNSLVLVDELGRGTSTFEGFGLAWEIARYLASRTKCMTLFATHFHELGDLAEEVHGVFNSQVTASVDLAASQLVLLFGVKPGCADVSYGVKVAEMAGLDPNVVAEAKRKAEELEAIEAQTIKGTKSCEKRRRLCCENVSLNQDIKTIYSILKWIDIGCNNEGNNSVAQICSEQINSFLNFLDHGFEIIGTSQDN